MESQETPGEERRTAIMEDPDYYRLRERLIGYLEDQAHGTPPSAETR